MAYPNGYLYLTAHWSYSSVPSEVGQFGLKFDSVAPASQALVDSCAGAVQALWQNATALIDFDVTLQFLRLAAIGTDGKYIPGTLAYDHVYAGGIHGAGNSSPGLFRYPLQVAYASRLLTAFPRGQAHEGRVYLPASSAGLASGYVIPIASANTRSNALASCLSALNTAMPGPLSVFSKGTKANPAVGAKHPVTGVLTGNRLDVQRRRAAQQPETQGAVFTV